MSTFWLKMIGTTENLWPLDKTYDLPSVGFRNRKPSGIRPGDRMVLYAVGGTKCIFAIVEVTSKWYDSKNKDWPYRVDIQVMDDIALKPSAGVCLAEVSSDLKVNRRSHLRLTPEQYAIAEAKLRKAKSKK